jgi:hypothetical protein
VGVNRLGGMPEAEAIFRSQLDIMGIKGLHTILGVCCTQCIFDSVYAVLGVCCTRCILHSVLTYDDGMER